MLLQSIAWSHLAPSQSRPGDIMWRHHVMPPHGITTRQAGLRHCFTSSIWENGSRPLSFELDNVFEHVLFLFISYLVCLRLWKFNLFKPTGWFVCFVMLAWHAAARLVAPWLLPRPLSLTAPPPVPLVLRTDKVYSCTLLLGFVHAECELWSLGRPSWDEACGAWQA